jgi:hypothetical protein
VDCEVSAGFEPAETVWLGVLPVFPTEDVVFASGAFFPHPAMSKDPANIHSANLMEWAFRMGVVQPGKTTIMRLSERFAMPRGGPRRINRPPR